LSYLQASLSNLGNAALLIFLSLFGGLIEGKIDPKETLDKILPRVYNGLSVVGIFYLTLNLLATREYIPNLGM
jgi:hypothetical protein